MFPADEQPFLAEIAAHPSADGPRLVYADYLSETGRPLDNHRAELIRVQVALEQLPPEDSRHEELANRAYELIAAHGRDWTAPLASLGAEFEFRRGIPDAVAIDAATFLSRGEELFDNTPIGSGRSFLRRVKLREPARVLPELVDCPFLNPIEELDLGWSDLGNGGVSLLVESPHLCRLRSLELGNNRLDDAGALALAGSDRMPNLQSLALFDNGQIGAAGAAAIADSPFLAGLVELDLSGNDLNDMALRSIVNGRSMIRLGSLRIGDNPQIGGGLTALVQSELFARLLIRDPRLDLHRCGIEAPVAEVLASSVEIPRLTSLNLEGNYLGDAGVAALCRGKFDNLRTLHLAKNQLTDASVRHLVHTPFPRLAQLIVAGNRMTSRGIEQLKEAASGRGFALDASDNGAETMAPLPPSLAERNDIHEVHAIKRGLAHPASNR